MDKTAIKKITETLQKTAERRGVQLDRVYLFGSRARGDASDTSDIDLLLVSPDFRGIPNYKRPKYFYRHWDYEHLPDPEFICLTPEDFEEKKKRKPHIVRTAVEEGISCA